MYLGAWRNALYDWEGGFGCSKVLSARHIQGNALCHADLCHTSPLACLKVLIHCRQRKGHFVGEDAKISSIYQDFRDRRRRIRLFFGDDVISEGKCSLAVSII